MKNMALHYKKNEREIQTSIEFIFKTYNNLFLKHIINWFLKHVLINK